MPPEKPTKSNRTADASGDYELWRYDPAARTPAQRVSDVWGGGSSLPEWMTLFGNQIYFVAFDGSVRDLFRYDPATGSVTRVRQDTSPTPQLVVDLVQGAAGSFPAELAAVGGRLFFSSSTLPATLFWIHDPVGSQTIAIEADGNSGSNFVAAGSSVYFAAVDASAGNEQWRYAPTAPAAVALRTINATPPPLLPLGPIVATLALMAALWQSRQRALRTSGG